MDDYRIEGRPQVYVRDGLVHIEEIFTDSFTIIDAILKKLQKKIILKSLMYQ